jgi:hypothetical protein
MMRDHRIVVSHRDEFITPTRIENNFYTIFLASPRLPDPRFYPIL